MESRRTFLGKIAAAGALAAFSPLELLAAPRRDKRALLYDLQLGSFGSKQTAFATRADLAKKLPELATLLEVGEEKGRYALTLDISAPAEQAEMIGKQLERKGIGSFKRMYDEWYNASRTADMFSYLVIEKSLPDTVRKYTTAYTVEEVQDTVNSLLGLYREKRLPYPGAQDVVPIPMRFLKMPYRLGMTQGKEFKAVELKRGQLLRDIAEEMEGDLKHNESILRQFNDIKRGQERYLSPGTRILIPSLIMGDPEEPIIVNGTEDAPRIIHAPPAATPKQKERAKIAEAYEQEIPEVSASITAYLRQQSLGVLRDTEMPGVLLESFNIKNYGHRRFYSDDRNLRKLAVAYGQGILDYCASHPQVSKIIIDNGHGEKDPGTSDPVSKMTETQFTKRIQAHLADFLRSKGKRVHTLNYTGRASARARVRYYTGEANRIGEPNDSVYIATHVDAMGTGHQPPPRAFVHKGQQPRSKALAAAILNRAVPFYKDNYR